MHLATCSYRAWRPWLGQPVVTSLTVPKWMPEAKEWPVAYVLTPRWGYFDAEPDEFDRQYLAQLERFGAAKIARALHTIGRETGAERLVLLCHEADPERCHRWQFAEWLTRTTGELIEEVGIVPATKVGIVPATKEER